MTLSISITFPASTPSARFRVRTWDDPVLHAADGMSAEERDMSTFQEVPLATERGGFGAIAQFQTLGSDEYDAVRALQNVNDQWNASLQQKLGWLIQDTDTPGAPVSEYWIDNGVLKIGTMLNGGNVIEVETNPDGTPKEYILHNLKYRAEPAGTRHDISFYRPVGLRRSQIPDVLAGRITHATHPHLIHKCTIADKKGDAFLDHVYDRGYIFTPVWSDVDYPSNNGAPLLIAKLFVVPV